MKVVLLNAGSSSLKCSLVESANHDVLAQRSVQLSRDYGDAARQALEEVGVSREAPPAAIGHRIVHGGAFSAPVRVTAAVRDRITALSDLAPLHNPPGLEVLAAAESLLPEVPQVAVFDTAFHATLPAAAYTYPVPRAWIDDWGIRRYGFHGLSHAYCTTRAAELLGRNVSELRTIICHLGHGCSATAVDRGRSVDTTMGFTPLDGLMMATRSGEIDPGIVTYVQSRHGLTARDVDDALNHRAGLLGISGTSADMRGVQAAARSDDRARLAIEVYVHRVRQAIGAFAVTLGGVDALVFTAGVGEHAPEIRAAVCRGLGLLGLELDGDANASCRPDADIARAGARARILVVTAREDLVMLAGVLTAIGASA